MKDSHYIDLDEFEIECKKEVFEDILKLKEIEREVLQNNYKEVLKIIDIQTNWLLGYADFYNEVLKIKKKHLNEG